MADVVTFDPNRKGTRFFEGDCQDFAVYDDGKCFGINPGEQIGFCPNKNYLDITCYEGHEVSREEFAKMYPQAGL